jgi:hypothetical protein
MKPNSIWHRGNRAAKLCLVLVLAILAGACSNPAGSNNYGNNINSGNFTIPSPPAGGPPYTVTYFNFTVNTTGNTPTDPHSYAAGSTVTVLGNTGSPMLSWPGFTFMGWNTKQTIANNLDGGNGGVSYAPNDTFTINANTYLFGVWR